MQQSPPVWDGVLRHLATELPRFAFEAWIQPLQVEEADDHLQLLAPSVFHRERVRSRFLAAICACAEKVARRPLDVRLDVAPDLPAAAQGPAASGSGGGTPSSSGEQVSARVPKRRASAPSEQLTLPHTFESFVVGPTNALAREASLAVAQGRSIGVSPLYLVGPSGIGKSHLARAVVCEARRRGMQRVVYASAEQFTNELMASIRSRETPAFKRRFRQDCEVLVIEDVEFLQGKTATQLELFHTVEHLRLVGGRVVLTGDRLPREMPRLDPRLASQLTAGLVAEIELPNRALRRAILRERAARGGVRLPEDCLDLLVDSVRGSVRDLEGVLIQVVASATLLTRPIDRKLVEASLRKVGHCGAEESLDMAAVIECVASFFGRRPEELASRSRRRDVLLPRQLAMYLCRRYTDASLSEIGRAFGRDHPAVANAIRQIERGMLERAPLRYQVEELTARLERR